MYSLATTPTRAAGRTCPTSCSESQSSSVAWAVSTAHHADFADRGHAHIYQEGLRIPPIRLYRAGELQQDVQELILLNCQVPRERLSDLRAQMAANRLGVERIQALCRIYGTDTALAVGEALQDYAERKMRAGIAALPDGTYRFADTYDSPELGRALGVSLEIRIEGSEMRLHFDSPPQVRAGINMVYTALLSSVYYAVKAVVDPTIPPNSGLARPITVTASLGTVMNAMQFAGRNPSTGAAGRGPVAWLPTPRASGAGPSISAAVPRGLMWDPFADSGALVRAAEAAGMEALGWKSAVFAPRVAGGRGEVSRRDRHRRRGRCDAVRAGP
jgi:hypothetical protein